MTKIFVSTYPFATFDLTPLELLKKSGIEFELNPYQRKLTEKELQKHTKDVHGIIIGTENIAPILDSAKQLKMISRVGIGLDSIPLKECKKKNITVCYTPDAVTKAVSEFTVGLMISATRHIVLADRQVRHGIWKRLQGKRIENSSIGIIGLGRTGTDIVKLLSSFNPKQILIHDIKNKKEQIQQFQKEYSLNIQQVTQEAVFKNSDIISLHIPLTPKTKNLISKHTLNFFKKDSFLINVSRGEIIHESDLYETLINKKIAGCALDVFQKEPYFGKLSKLENVILTQHMGSCSFDCRIKMEKEATEELIRFFKNQSLHNEVPITEYEYQMK